MNTCKPNLTFCRGILANYQWYRYHSEDKSSTTPTLKTPKTPKGKFDSEPEATKIEKPEPDAYGAFPENTNPKTGEIGGPRGPEPTRYGDWERKGRVSDF